MKIPRRWSRNLIVGLCLAGLCLAGLAAGGRAQEAEPFEDPPINYSATKPNDRASKLNEAFRKQADEIRGWPARRRLRWLLDQLDVPVDSQILVFSKTSHQRAIIGPKNPRVLFFSDEAYVGWVPGGAMEVTLFDPVLGATFYLLDATEDGEKPILQRDNQCLSCHKSYERTPSLRARSVMPDAEGEALSGSSISNIDPDTPYTDRWGGWYVTGAPSPFRHRGNTVGKTEADFRTADGKGGVTLQSLKDYFDIGRYPKPTSDIVALSVHDHQVFVHNVLAAANQTARLSLARWPATREILQLPADAPLAGSTLVSLTSEADKVISALLCREEPALPAEGLRGDGEFEKSYEKGRRADPQGRALRDLDLKTRLFRYRCSPLIYSESFKGFPPELRTLVLTRLAAILRAEEPPADYAYLPAAERKAIDEILTATLPDLPASWRRK
jgi:hypothetical protein